VKRSLSQSHMLARKLLALHMDSARQSAEIDEIVQSLTSKLFYHGHPINRIEANEQIKLPTIENPSVELEDLMWQLYLEYETEMKMESPFNPAMEFIAAFPALQAGAPQPSITPTAKTKVVYVESSQRTDVFTMDYQISGIKQPNGVVQTTYIMLRQGWELE
jgi:hypothetical protein